MQFVSDVQRGQDGNRQRPSRRRGAPHPPLEECGQLVHVGLVLVALNDRAGTRYYVDPKSARIVGGYSSANFLDRWLYHGLHSMNFPWLYNYRPAWDIVQLHNNRWISAVYQPLGCATTGATPHCGESVQVGSDCHFAPGVNYVVFGAMCKLCDIWPSTMKLMIWGHKVHWSGMDPDYESSKRWAQAGYDGWPASATPAGDRNNCSPPCPRNYRS